MIEFSDEAQRMKTNRDEKINVKSQLESQRNTYELTYEFKMIDQVGIILNAYKIDQFMLTDYFTETEDYILYCKTFDEIGELIEAKTQITLNVASIFEQVPGGM